jgi:membrane-associated HD superfamily phosphohydrolase
MTQRRVVHGRPPAPVVSRERIKRREDDAGRTDSLMGLLKNIAAIAGITSAVVYAFLWLAYYQFYSNFAISPEEVGLGKTELLSQALVGPVILFGIFTALSVSFIFSAFIYPIVLALLEALVVALPAALVFVVSSLLSREPQTRRTTSSIRRNLRRRGHRVLAFLRTRRTLLIAAFLLVSIASGFVQLLIPMYTKSDSYGDRVYSHGIGIEDFFRTYWNIDIPTPKYSGSTS